MAIIAERLFHAWGVFIESISAEWLLTGAQRPNGGSVIVLRSTLTSVLIYAAILGLRNLVDPHRTWTPSATDLRLQIIETFPLFGTIFAAMYAALYARFASQWTYLANLYNQIKAAQCKDNCAGQPLADWKAAFIEDAQELHLALKPLFASVIHVWGNAPEVQTAFDGNTPGGKARLDALMIGVEDVYRRSARRWRRLRDTDHLRATLTTK